MSTDHAPRTRRAPRGRTPIRALVVVGMLACAAACSSGNQAHSPFDGPAPSGSSSTDDPIVVEIQNLSFNDISVWAVRPGGQRQRIARVTGKSDQTVRIGWNVAVPISFYIEQTAGRSCRTGSVGVEADARVMVNVPSNVGLQPCRAWRR